MSTKREVSRGQKVLKMGKSGTFCEVVTITYQGWSPRGLSSTSRTPRGQKFVALASMLSGLGLDLEHAKPKHAKSLQGLHFDV